MIPLIRPYQKQTDNEAVFGLWQITLGTQWPFDRETFDWLIGGNASYQPGNRLVAHIGPEIVGFVAVQAEPDRGQGNLALLTVLPSYQRQGIGRQLHKVALQHLRLLGVKRVQLGGGSPRVWPGLPVEPTVAVEFFQAQGWQYTESSYDLIKDLRNYITPLHIYDKMTTVGATFDLAEPTSYAEIISFHTQEFPNWLDFYRDLLDTHQYDAILLVRDKAGTVIGSLIMYSRASHPDRTDVNWKASFGPDAGAIGCVGIAQAYQNRGLGSAVMAHASQLLSERGVSICLIGWTHRPHFYERIGYRLWKTYRMSWRSL